ncbi:MAG: hypothetical protein AVDCRST_MAG26-1566 [uncultured Chloroflexia bacterium]|uniref:LURP-one-related family protein n=1 Tax=uncultured Chloroflexia bacterium TaxID=1672391 RepID=A0A6J4I700_9CHLR|nr:MAG: hypothetical protein AVDCRST_MAG26-1566 [uncultured Chloroflexia bacterium]
MSFGQSNQPRQYRMRQRLFALGEDFDIENADGQPVLHVDGKLLRIRETFVIQDLQGNEVATIRQKLVALRPSMTISRGGVELATIRKAWISLLSDRFGIEVAGGEDLSVVGDIFDHEYEIRRGGDVVAAVSKQWFTIRDTYGITVAPGEDDGMILGVAVALDELAHDPDEQQH